MYNFAPEEINEGLLGQVMPIWKQHQALVQKLIKMSSKGSAKLILDFICASVEYKLKKNILDSSNDKSMPELKDKLQTALKLRDKDLKE